MSVFCESCGTALPDGARFCPNCGKIIDYTPAGCPNCGTAINGESFCPNCGLSLNGESPNSDGAYLVRRQKSKVAILILLLVLALLVTSVAILLASRLGNDKPSGENNPVADVTTPENVSEGEVVEPEPPVGTEPEENPIELNEGSFWALTEGVYKNNDNVNFLMITSDGHSSLVMWGIMNSGGMETGFVTDFRSLGDNKYAISLHFDEIDNEMEYAPAHDSEITLDISDFKSIGKLYVEGTWAEDPGYNYVGGPDLNNLYN